MDCSIPGFLVHHQLPEPAQTHVHHIGDAIQPSHPLSSPLVGARALKCDRDPEEGAIQTELHLRAHGRKMHSWILSLKDFTEWERDSWPPSEADILWLLDLVSSTFKEKKKLRKEGIIMLSLRPQKFVESSDERNIKGWFRSLTEFT